MRQSVQLAADMGNLEAKTFGKKIAFPVDFVPLKCGNVSFSYTRYGGKETLPVLMNMSAEIPQGAVVCVCGPQGHGKSTFLQLMGQVLIPDTGEVFVPPHLRVLHVSSEVYFIAEDIKVNLFFGRGKDTVLVVHPPIILEPLIESPEQDLHGFGIMLQELLVQHAESGEEPAGL